MESYKTAQICILLKLYISYIGVKCLMINKLRTYKAKVGISPYIYKLQQYFTLSPWLPPEHIYIDIVVYMMNLHVKSHSWYHNQIP